MPVECECSPFLSLGLAVGIVAALFIGVLIIASLCKSLLDARRFAQTKRLAIVDKEPKSAKERVSSIPGAVWVMFVLVMFMVVVVFALASMQ